MSTVTYSADREKYLNGSLTIIDRVKYFLEKIDERKSLNLYARVYSQEALDRAIEIQKKVEQGQAGILAGMVIALKDNICYKNHPLQAASITLQNYIPSYNASIVNQLLLQDAIIIGHTNCDEFAMGSANEFSCYGRAMNPIDPNRVTGGSSGGSAGAVSAGWCHAAIGTDTGGSVRQPAAFCGVVGWKPSYGMISRYGVVNYSSSLDHVGLITNDHHDLKTLMSVLTQKDLQDHTHHPERIKNPQKLTKMAYIADQLQHPKLDPEIKRIFFRELERLKRKGVRIEPITFPWSVYFLPVYNAITTTEAATNLARYDGQRFGFHGNAESWVESIRKSRTKSMGWEVKRKIMMGNALLSQTNQPLLHRAKQLQQKIIRETERIFHDYDLLVSPTTPTVAFPANQKKDVVTMYLQDVFTFHANLCGIPAITIPRHTHSSGMPLGIQFAAQKYNDLSLLDFARRFGQ